MANTSFLVISWTVAAFSGLIFLCVIAVLAIKDWLAVPRDEAKYEAVLITARANLRLFSGLAIVEVLWFIAGMTATLAIPGHNTATQRALILCGLMIPSYILPSLALLELLDRRRATAKLREVGI